jgi:hypothetical protein
MSEPITKSPLKRRSTIILHGSISQKTTLNIILAAVRTWNLTLWTLSTVSVELKSLIETRRFGDWNLSPKHRVLIKVFNFKEAMDSDQKICRFNYIPPSQTLQAVNASQVRTCSFLHLNLRKKIKLLLLLNHHPDKLYTFCSVYPIRKHTERFMIVLCFVF